MLFNYYECVIAFQSMGLDGTVYAELKEDQRLNQSESSESPPRNPLSIKSEYASIDHTTEAPPLPKRKWSSSTRLQKIPVATMKRRLFINVYKVEASRSHATFEAHSCWVSQVIRNFMEP